MYRILIILSSIVLLATSCQKETRIDTPATLTYTVVPEVSFDVKSGEEVATINSEVNILSYLVYHKKENGEFVYVREMGDFVKISGTSNINVPITLIKDQTYKLVFIAQHRFESNQRTDCYAYTYNNTYGTMAVNPSAPFANGDQLEAYVFVDEVGPITGNENRNATLRRIVSQINIGTSAATYPEHLNIAVTGAATSYNVFEGTYAEDASSVNIYNIATPTAGTDHIKVSTVDYNRLATIYCLGSNKLGLTLTNTADAQNNFTINNVSTQVNYKTNIVGNILAGTYTVQADNLDTFTSALANPKVTHIELTAPIYIKDTDLTIDGRGVVVTQAKNFENGVTSSKIRGIITIENSNVTLKDIRFQNTHTEKLIDVDIVADANGNYLKEFIADGITVTGHTTTAGPLITLRGKGKITNCHFENNTCAGKGLIHFERGNGGLILDGNKFINNRVETTDSDAGIIYLVYRPDCTIGNNTLTDNYPNNEIKQ